MLTSPLTLTYDAESVTLNRVDGPDDYAGGFYGQNAAGDEFNLTIKHTLPKGTSLVESHLARLDATFKDAEGVPHTYSVWKVLKVSGTQEDDDVSVLVNTAFDALVDTSVVGIILDRRS